MIKLLFLNWYARFSTQPHQPFFASGISFLIIFALAIIAHFSNTIIFNTSIVYFHIYPLIFIVFIQFFLGFLFIVLPKFLGQEEIPSKTYMKLFWLYLSSSILYIIGLLTLNFVIFLSALILLASQVWAFSILFNIYKKSIIQNKNDTTLIYAKKPPTNQKNILQTQYDIKWVLIAFLAGIFAHILFLVSHFHFSLLIEKLAIYSGFYLFLFVLIFSIAQRMIPFFTRVKIPSYIPSKSKYIMEIIFSLLIFKIAILLNENPKLNIIVDLPLFLFFTYEIIKWKLPITKVPAIIWVLYIALAWIPLGFLLSSIESLNHIFLTNPLIFKKSVIHAFAIGYFITILIGFGSRVILGHSGHTITANSLTTFTFIFIQLIALVRIFASLGINYNFDYIYWINISSILLITALMVWSIKYLNILIAVHKTSIGHKTSN